MFKNLIISAPFGNWIRRPYATSTLGTFTLHYRGGLLYRFWRMLLTMRYYWKLKSWINRLGLPNPGLSSLPRPSLDINYNNQIISIFGFNIDEWRELAKMLTDVYLPMAAELNMSCPNVEHPKDLLVGAGAAVHVLAGTNIDIIAKLPPVRWLNFAIPMYDLGVRTFHCCNTIPTPGGGMSGKVLKQYSLWCVNDLRDRWGDEVTLIGGGGIDSVADVLDYRRAGANRCAVGQMAMNPFKHGRLLALAEAMT